MNRPASGKQTKATSPSHSQRGHGSPHSALTGRDRGFWRGRLFSFAAAVSGALHVIRTQPNAWIELAALVVVAAAAWYFQVSAVEWAVLAVCIFGVLALEAINTSVEAIIDLVSPHYHPLAKIAKDAAAGALVFAVLGSLCVASAVFGPRIVVLFLQAP
jgi:diacylglycerol kinase